MTGSTAYNVILNAVNFLRNEVPGEIRLDPNRKLGNGKTKQDPYYTAFYVGVAGLEGSSEELDDGTAGCAILALFHEVCGHGGQLKYEAEKDTDLSAVLLLNNYACIEAPDYYDGGAGGGEFSERYSRQPFEIAAQYMALRSARSYLPRVLGGAETDKLLLAAVNHRISMGSEFIGYKDGKPYEDLDAVLEAFDARFGAMADAHRDYDPDADRFDVLHRSPLKTKDAPRRAARCRSGIRQDMMCCAALAADHPRNARYFNSVAPDNSITGRKPAFSRVDLSEENAFRRILPAKAPDPRSASLIRLTDMVAEIDRRDGASRGPSGPAPP